MALKPNKIQKLQDLFLQLNSFGTKLEDKNIEEQTQFVEKVILQLGRADLFNHKLLDTVQYIPEDKTGSGVEDYFHKLAREYNVSDITKATPVPLDEIIDYVHKINFRKVYATSMTSDIREGMKSPSVFANYIDSLNASLKNTRYYKQLDNMLEVLKNVVKVSTKVQTPGNSIGTTNVINSSDVATIRETAIDMKLPSSKYTLTFKKNGDHSDALTIFSKKLILFYPANLSFVTEEYVNSINVDKVLREALPEIDEFIALPGLNKLFIIDDEVLKCFTVKEKLNIEYNGAEDKTEYFLHVNEIYSYSPFANAVEFVTQA